MSSYLTVKNGIYDPSKRFAFTNISSTDFTFSWGGKPITVKTGDVVEMPHHLAVLATGKLVDQIMMGIAREDEIKMRLENKDPYWRSPKGISVGIPEARKPYEDKVLRELAPDEENPQTAMMRASMREQLMHDLSAEKAQTIDKISVPLEQFAEIKEKI